MSVSQTAQIPSKTYILKGYVRPLGNGKFMGVCLTLNLVVESDSFEGAKRALEAIITAYVMDAVKDGDFGSAMRRPAAWQHYAEYYLCSILLKVHASRTAFYRFSETQPIPQHA